LIYAELCKVNISENQHIMITVLNYLALKSTATSNGSAFVRGKSTSGDGGEGTFLWDSSSSETPNEATIIESTITTTGRWKRVIEEKVNVQWFGAVPDSYKGHDNFCAVPDGTPNYSAIQKAIDFCIANGYDLYFPAGRRDKYGVHGEYMVEDTLKIIGLPNDPVPPSNSCNSKNKYASLNIYAEVNATITGYILDKTKPIFLFEGCKQGKMENLTIQGCGYIPLAGIQFIATAVYDDKDILTGYINSEGMELYNVKIFNCRHGVFTEQAETLNRMVFNRCVFVANLIARFYLKSINIPTETGFPGSAPVTFTNTIINGNGIPQFIATGDVSIYEGVAILNKNDKYGFQLYANGFGNLSYFGGQISGHGDSRMLSLVSLENGGGVNFSGVDIEDIHTPVTEGGNLIDTSQYDTDFGNFAGSAINVINVSDFNLIQSHVYNINTQSVFKFVGRCYDVNIELMDIYKEYIASGNYKYSVDVAQSNFGDFLDPGTWHDESSPEHPMNVLTRLHYKGPKDKLSTTAFNALDRSGLQVLTSIKELVPSANINTIFTHIPGIGASGTKYIVGNNGPYNGPFNTPVNLTNALFIEKDIIYGTVFHAIVECTQNYNQSGLFFLQQVDISGAVKNKVITLQGNGKIGYGSNYTYYTYLTQQLDPSTKKIRYGFINNSSNSGFIPDNVTVKGITAYIDYHNPVQNRRPIDMDF